MFCRNWFAGVITLGMVLLVLSSCTGGSQKPIETTPAAEKIKLRIMWWGPQQRHATTIKALEAYSKLNPRIEFEIEVSGMEGYLDRLLTLSTGNNAPDLFQLDPSWVADWYYKGHLEEIVSGFDQRFIDEKMLEMGRFNNKIYAVPMGTAAYGMIYDKASMEKTGLALPANGWHWNDYFELIEELKRRLSVNQYVSKDYAGDYFAYSAYQYARGKGKLITDEGKFNVDRATFLEWAYTWERLRENGVTPPPELNASDKEFDPVGDLLVKGHILIRLSPSNAFASWDSLKPGAYGLVTMPRAQQAGGWLKPSMFMGLSPASKHKEEAVAVMDWLINNEEAGRMLGTTRGLPANSKVAEAILPSLSPGDKTGMALYEATRKDGQRWTPGASGWTYWIDKEWALIGDELSFGKKTPEEAFEMLKITAVQYEK